MIIALVLVPTWNVVSASKLKLSTKRVWCVEICVHYTKGLARSDILSHLPVHLQRLPWKPQGMYILYAMSKRVMVILREPVDNYKQYLFSRCYRCTSNSCLLTRHHFQGSVAVLFTSQGKRKVSIKSSAARFALVISFYSFILYTVFGTHVCTIRHWLPYRKQRAEIGACHKLFG